MSDARWIGELAAGVERYGRAVLVTLANATGSTPREAGTVMVVSAGEIFGSIGGGHLEFEAIRVARDALAQSPLPAPSVVRFPLAARLGQCCGGVATLAFAVIASDNGAWISMRQHASAKVPRSTSSPSSAADAMRTPWSPQAPTGTRRAS